MRHFKFILLLLFLLEVPCFGSYVGMCGGGGGGGGTWGSITGTLSDQGDLINALNAKATSASPTFTGTIGTPLTASRVMVTDSSGNLAISSTAASALAGFAPLASPSFTGTVTLPTGLSGVVKAASGVVSAGTVDLTSQVANALPIANGGTAQTSANAALNGFLPTQTSNSGKFLTTDGSNSSWGSISGASSTLNNLTSPTAINQSLFMGTDNTYSIGDDSGANGVGKSRPSVIDSVRVNSPTVCLVANGSTPGPCLVASGTSFAVNLGGTNIYTFANGTFTVGGAAKQDLVLTGDIVYSTQQKVTITNAGSSTINAQTPVFMIHGTGTIAAYTITMPASPSDGQDVSIITDITVTALTVSPNSGQTMIPTYTTITPNTPIRLTWENQYGEWVAK